MVWGSEKPVPHEPPERRAARQRSVAGLLRSALVATLLVAGCSEDGGSAGASAAGTDSSGGAGDAAGAGAVGGSDAGAGGQGASDAATSDADFSDPLAGMGPVEVAKNGFGRIEGPVWLGGALYFSDIPNDRIHRLDPPDTFGVFREPSGNSNGLGFDAALRLLVCEQSNHRITRIASDGKSEILADTWQGHPFNSPNDLAVRSDGTIYFTDPGFDYPAPDGPGYQGVYRIDASSTLSLETDELDRPNGITLSLDQTKLYVDDTLAARLRRYPVAADGSLGNGEDFATTAPIADGMCLDDGGNLYVTTSEGVQAFAPDATLLGAIPVPGFTTNCAFGDADRRSLYVTAGASLYRVRMAVTGGPF